MPQRDISPERKALYYVGNAVSLGGIICFFSGFLLMVSNFGNFDHFEERGRTTGVRCVLGIMLAVGGQFIARVGRMGAAGSGLKLDPQEARRDVEPWSRMTGGVIKDTLDEAGLQFGGRGGGPGKDLPFDERLRRLRKLRDDGLVSAEEYEATKKKILEGA